MRARTLLRRSCWIPKHLSRHPGRSFAELCTEFSVRCEAVQDFLLANLGSRAFNDSACFCKSGVEAANLPLLEHEEISMLLVGKAHAVVYKDRPAGVTNSVTQNSFLHGTEDSVFDRDAVDHALI